ncbi:HpcH/HpaI aldolase/citrate lyase family protein [Pseudonocardia saturnea]
MVIRTLLFVPGDRPSRIATACAAPADAVAVDLEDAVATSAKAAARGTATAAIAAAAPRQGLFLRINPLDGPWAGGDLVAACSVLPRLAGLIVPKAEEPDAVRALDRDLAAAEEAAGLPAGRLALLPIVESARGVLAAPAIAHCPRVATLVLGTLDLAADLGVSPTVEGRELLHARSHVVLATAAARLPGPLDGPHPDLDDDAGLVRSSVVARELGFTGRVVLHPRQLDAVRAAFSPGDAELGWARRVLAAHERAQADGVGAVRLDDGTFVDRPVVLRASALLAAEESL